MIWSILVPSSEQLHHIVKSCDFILFPPNLLYAGTVFPYATHYISICVYNTPYCQATRSPYCSPPAWEYAGPPRYGDAYRQTVAVVDEATQADPPVSPFILRYGIRADKTSVFDKTSVSVSPSRSCRALSHGGLPSDMAAAVMAFRRLSCLTCILIFSCQGTTLTGGGKTIAVGLSKKPLYNNK